MPTFILRGASRASLVRLTRGAWALLLAIGCTAAPSEPILPPSDARLVGRLDGESFVGLAEARVKHTLEAPDSLYLWAQRPLSPNGGTVQWLSIRIALTGVGTYVLNESQVSLLEIVGGDVVSSARRGSALAPGVLTLSEIGATGDLVVGTARFTLSPADGRPAYPEPVDFTDGEFTVRLSAPYGMPPAIR